ncbi:MAG: phosphopantothenoylcysteine decarboxylase domain-containing protein [Planctomycetota bacterium]
MPPKLNAGKNKTLNKMHLLITAGGTREYIDPVRFITNASSGRMGYALASAAVKAGHKATLITTPADQQPPKEAKIVKVETTAQMLKAVQQQFSRCDCLIMAAAVADYTPVKKAKSKIKKTNKSLTIKLKPTTDILKWTGKHKKKNQVVVGFALEDKKLKTRAEKKLKEKNLDMIVANRPNAIGSSKSTVYIKTTSSSWTKIENASKTTIARRIIQRLENG